MTSLRLFCWRSPRQPGSSRAWGRTGISGARGGWLLDAAQALETFLDPQMRSPSAEACGKRLERSKTRLKQKHRQNPSSV